MAPDQVARFRTAVDDERRGGDLESRLAALAATEIEGEAATATGDLLETRPRGVDPDHPRLDLLRHSASTATAAGRRTTSCTRRARWSGWRRRGGRLRPLTEWLDDHVGPSEHQR